MKLPKSAHTSRPWRIHELTSDFRLEDVWELPASGGSDDFPRLVEVMASLDPSRGSVISRTLFAIRLKAGELLHWDDSSAGLGARVPTLRDRLPEDLRGTEEPPAAGVGDISFSPLYLIDDEMAMEIANRTVHGVLHIGWVPDESGGHRGQLAVLVKPNGTLGSAYMAAILPFRYLIVYPAMLREIGRRWRETER